ncbi:MAG: MFS transporter, partial [Pseudomonas sp.]|nr:MFS transporter [Pseudomonas sp.]
GARAGGLFPLSRVLSGAGSRFVELLRANAQGAQLWGIGCLLGPLLAGAGSQWISGHALLFLMAAGAAGLVVLTRRRGAFEPVSA